MAGARPLLAGVELGGTKCVCILGTGPEDIRAQARVQTRDSETTLAEIAAVLSQWRTQYGSPEGLGIACFGPLDLRAGSPTFGHVLCGPKADWAKSRWDKADVLGRLATGLDVPVEINTDVNAAALAEGRWGAARGLEDFAYVTVGTGIGVGLIVAGQTVFGAHHPELGHVHVARVIGDAWPGHCPYHGDCVEGLASGPAIAARTGIAPVDLGPTHPAWELVAHALGQLAHTLVLATGPRRILFGGGVVQNRPELLARVREHLVGSLNGYLRIDELSRGINEFIAPAGLGALAGPLGALALAADAARRSPALA
jgi:fructokinase